MFAVAGIESHHKLFHDDTECWLSTLWEKCFECIDSTAEKISLVKVDKDSDRVLLKEIKKKEEAQKPDSSVLSSLAGAVVGLAGFTFSYFKSSSNSDEKN